MQTCIFGVAVSDTDAKELMEKSSLMAKKLTPESLASIMLYNKHEGKLCVHVAPSIPQEAVDALNGLQVGCVHVVKRFIQF